MLEMINASSGPQPVGGYSQSMKIKAPATLLFVSGQIPESADGKVAEEFSAQARQVWSNIEGQLEAGGMGIRDIVKVTTFLSDRRYREQNSVVRQEVLAGHAPALTVIICDIYDERWLLEIEVIAAK